MIQCIYAHGFEWSLGVIVKGGTEYHFPVPKGWEDMPESDQQNYLRNLEKREGLDPTIFNLSPSELTAWLE